MSAALFGDLSHLRGFQLGSDAIRLVWGRQILWTHPKELLFAVGPHQLNGGLVAIHEYPGFGVEEPDGIRAPLEKQLEHAVILPVPGHRDTGPFGPFTRWLWRTIHQGMNERLRLLAADAAEALANKHVHQRALSKVKLLRQAPASEEEKEKERLHNEVALVLPVLEPMISEPRNHPSTVTIP